MVAHHAQFRRSPSLTGFAPTFYWMGKVQFSAKIPTEVRISATAAKTRPRGTNPSIDVDQKRIANGKEPIRRCLRQAEAELETDLILRSDCGGLCPYAAKLTAPSHNAAATLWLPRILL
jgi:hypothetical protein